MTKKNEIYCRRDEGTLMPQYIEDYISDRHPARFIDTFVNNLDLDKLGFKKRKSQIGRPNYPNSVLLKIWLYAYYCNITHLRKIELACQEYLPLMFLTGGKSPDHNTIWRFFNNNRDAIENLFKKSVHLAAEMKLIGIITMALDGTKIEADVSTKSTFHREKLEKLVDQIISQVDKKGDEISRNFHEDKTFSYLLEEIPDNELFEETVKKNLEKLDKIGRKHLSETDPDCRMMRFGDGKTRMGYNAQAAADSDSGIIVAADVTNAENDNHLLNKMIEQAEENTDDSISQTIADAGYYSGVELATAEENDREVLVNIKRQKSDSNQNPNSEYHIDKFLYDKANDCYICPHGGKLTFSRHKITRFGNKRSREYLCRDFHNCPFANKCTKSKRGRAIEISPYKESIKKQIQKQKDPKNKALLKMRKSIIEPIFGWLKREMKFKRFNRRTLVKVKAEWCLMCAVLNLKKIYKYAF